MACRAVRLAAGPIMARKRAAERPAGGHAAYRQHTMCILLLGCLLTTRVDTDFLSMAVTAPLVQYI